MAVQAKVKTKGSVKETIREFFDAEKRNGEKIQLHALGLTEDDDLPPYVHTHFPKALYRPTDHFGVPGATLLEQFDEVHAADEAEEADYRQQGFMDLKDAVKPDAQKHAEGVLFENEPAEHGDGGEAKPSGKSKKG
jgi:hypothetical protein